MNRWKAYWCFFESWLCWLPCLLTQRWFFRQAGGWRQSVGCYFVNGYYGAGRYWECYRSEK